MSEDMMVMLDFCQNASKEDKEVMANYYKLLKEETNDDPGKLLAGIALVEEKYPVETKEFHTVMAKVF